MLAPLARGAALVTVLDGHPATHAWLGAVRGQRVVPLGPDHFGQSGDIPDLYREYGIDTDAILDACAQALLGYWFKQVGHRVSPSAQSAAHRGNQTTVASYHLSRTIASE